MLSVSLVFCAIVALATALDVNSTHLAATPCPPGWTEHKDRCFFFDNNIKTWVDAAANCQQLGGNLASIRSDDENSFINALTNNAPAWVGGTDCQATGAWFWMDGTQMIARFWCPLKPDNELSQCCLQINTGVNKCWDDVPCTSTLPYVCGRHR
ncbi:type-2 ice-structuring protein-like [Corythoichthys intestinalis]|uniref:type-2 ice-structuring protein-like n=1 Tax=Corythoichthys intestinalis TaxID=161448 RepID=UPI0025A5EEBC|nr:type-2 ice-structuring protein-like [Corythoichthys intestinalis]